MLIHFGAHLITHARIKDTDYLVNLDQGGFRSRIGLNLGVQGLGRLLATDERGTYLYLNPEEVDTFEKRKGQEKEIDILREFIDDATKAEIVFSLQGINSTAQTNEDINHLLATAGSGSFNIESIDPIKN